MHLINQTYLYHVRDYSLCIMLSIRVISHVADLQSASINSIMIIIKI